MRRMIESHLIAWKKRGARNPLIIQGARQVGKTYIMKWFGRNHFTQYVYLNFEERPELKQFFEQNRDVAMIVQNLSLISGIKIDPTTLLIFDEIQECPQALNALKYFAESNLNIPVVCAGSLLGVLLHSGHSFPVGKVEFVSMYPMTFREVLPNWDARTAQYLEQIERFEAVPDYFFNPLVQLFKRYLITGGLPAVVGDMIESNSFERCEQILGNLLLSYKADFAKHPVVQDVARIAWVFDSLPSQLARENKKFVYQLVRTGARAREYEDAIRWLVQTGLAYQIQLNTKPGIPLVAYDDLNAFKLYAMDVGLLRKMAKLTPNAYLEGNRLFTEFKGAIAENYILQTLIVQFEDAPRYWTSGNTAEVDFLIQHRDRIIPIEVKSDENVKSRSLTLYRQKFKPAVSVRFSLRNLEFRDGLLNVPHFLADYLSRYLDSIDP